MPKLPRYYNILLEIKKVEKSPCKEFEEGMPHFQAVMVQNCQKCRRWKRPKMYIYIVQERGQQLRNTVQPLLPI
jgi:hypothetical protein